MKYNKFALTSMGFSVICLIGFGWFVTGTAGIPYEYTDLILGILLIFLICAFVFSIIASRQIKRSGEKGKAIVSSGRAVVIGVVIFISLFFLLLGLIG